MHEPRTIRFIRRQDLGDWRLKVYGIGTHAPDARPEFVEATVEAARGALPEGGGHAFVIAHDAKTAGLGHRLLVGERERDPRPLLRSPRSTSRRT
jgi:hypothetical protein